MPPARCSARRSGDSRNNDGTLVAESGPCTTTPLRSTALRRAAACSMLKSARFLKIHTGAWSYTLKASSADSRLVLNGKSAPGAGICGAWPQAHVPVRSETCSGPILMGFWNCATSSKPSRPSNKAR